MVLTLIGFHFKIAKKGLLSSENNSFYLIYLAYAFFLFVSFLYLVVIRIFLEIANTFSLIVIILSYIFSTKLEQIWIFIQNGKMTFFSELRLRLHLRYVADSLVFLADFNQIYGSAMFAFFLLLYPENATIWIVVFFSGKTSFQMSFLFRLLLMTIAFNMILFGTALHYKAISLTERLSDSGQHLAKVAVYSRAIRNLKARLKLERYISLFHSQDRPHSVTYGRNGNVTMGSFGKVTFQFVICKNQFVL